MSNGYYKISRKLKDSSEIKNKPAWWRWLWVHLIEIAYYMDSGQIKRSEIFTTYEKIYDGAGLKYAINDHGKPITIPAMKKVFRIWKEAEMITVKQVKTGMIIRLINYDKHQFLPEKTAKNRVTAELPLSFGVVTPEVTSEKKASTGNNRGNDTLKTDEVTPEVTAELPLSFGGVTTNIKNKEREEREEKKNNVSFGHTLPPPLKLIFDESLKDFNEVTGQNRTVSPELTTLIRSGVTLDQIKIVNRSKFEEWKDDPEMKKYIRPKTLYAKSNFFDYLESPNNNASPPTINDHPDIKDFDENFIKTYFDRDHCFVHGDHKYYFKNGKYCLRWNKDYVAN